MDNLNIKFGIFSRALQKKVHKSLKFSRGSFWTSGRIKFFYNFIIQILKKIEAVNPTNKIINWCGIMLL